MKKNALIISAIVLIVFLVGTLLSNTKIAENLELLSYDLRSRLVTDDGLFGKTLNQADKDIVIVAIDNYSMKELVEAPRDSEGVREWEKNVWEKVLGFIEAGEPKAVLFNMVFEKISDKPWYNGTFSAHLKQYDNTVLGTYLDNPIKKNDAFSEKLDLEQNEYQPTSTPLDVQINDKKLDKAITYTLNAPVHNVYTKFNYMGVLNSVLDTDNNVRKNQPIFKLVKDGETYYMPSLAFAGFLRYVGEDGKIVIKDKKILYKGHVIPLQDDGTVILNKHNFKRSYSYIPISKILMNKGTNKELQPDFFKDKLVIIGKTAVGDKIQMDSLIDSSYTSPEANALALDNYINDTTIGDKSARKFISEVSKPMQILITIVACLIVVFLGLVSKSAFIGCINGFLSILLYLIFCFWLFVHPSTRLVLPIIVPIFYLSVTSGIVFAYRFYKETIKKNSITETFGRFVSPKVLSSVLKNPNQFVLKNTKKRVTVLFCDVKDFSSLSEKYDPEKLVENLNELFKEIVNIIFENNGTVDKFIGDCIMAYWGGDLIHSENDAYLAVKTALEIKKKVAELKILNAHLGKIIFDVKIGINTGEAVLGLAGTDKFMSYTAMGDAVNTAARLETACSAHKREILISKSTYNDVKDKIIALEVGEIKVKGKEEKINVYEPIGFVQEDSTEII